MTTDNHKLELRMSNWLTGLFDRVFAVVGALVCAQAPMFIQQYGHQLSGRVAELKLQVGSIASAAAQGHKSVPQYIQRFIDSGDQDFMLQGELMQKMSMRYGYLSEALQDLNTTSIWAKPFVFIRDFNWDIAQSTLKDFQPGIPFTLEGLVYALIGIGLGYGLFSVLSAMGRYCYCTVANCFKKSAETDVKSAP